jgi:hypothetical protein
MACNHERIKSVNCVIYCCDCGAELPIDYRVGRERIEQQKAAEQPAEQPKKRGRKKVNE